MYDLRREMDKHIEFSSRGDIYYYKSFEIWINRIFNEIEIKNIITGKVSEISYESFKTKTFDEFLAFLNFLHRDISIDSLI